MRSRGNKKPGLTLQVCNGLEKRSDLSWKYTRELVVSCLAEFKTRLKVGNDGAMVEAQPTPRFSGCDGFARSMVFCLAQRRKLKILIHLTPLISHLMYSLMVCLCRTPHSWLASSSTPLSATTILVASTPAPISAQRQATTTLYGPG